MGSWLKGIGCWESHLGPGSGCGSDENERETGPRGGCPLKRMILEVRKEEKGTPGGVLGHLEAEALGSQGSCLNVDSGSVGLGCGFGISNKLQVCRCCC